MLHTRLPRVDMKPQAANDAKNESYLGAKSPRLQNDSPAPGFGTPEYYSALVTSHILSSRSAPTTAAKHKQLINSLVPLIEMSEMHILLELEHLFNETLEKHTISQSQLSRVRSLLKALPPSMIEKFAQRNEINTIAVAKPSIQNSPKPTSGLHRQPDGKQATTWRFWRRRTNDLEASDRTRPAFEQTRKFENYSNVMNFNKRLGMALFGGLVLILPMLIMVLHPRKTKSLITSSIFTMAFALVQAFWADAKTDLVLSTAAYAAVLVDRKSVV